MTCSRSRNPPNTDGSADHYAPQAGPALSRKKPTQIGNTKNPFAMNTLKTIFTFFFTLCFMMVANGYAQKTDSINTEAGKSVLHRNAIYIPPALEQYADTTLLHQRFNTPPLQRTTNPLSPLIMGFYIHWAKDSTIALWEKLIAFSDPKQTKVSSSSQAISLFLVIPIPLTQATKIRLSWLISNTLISDISKEIFLMDIPIKGSLPTIV